MKEDIVTIFNLKDIKSNPKKRLFNNKVPMQTKQLSIKALHAEIPPKNIIKKCFHED